MNGDDREYFVHVPAGYKGSAQTPVVFMLHGTNGNGEDFYTDSGWKEVGEAENIITVFPSSWKYCIVEDGQQNQIRRNGMHNPQVGHLVLEKPLEMI